MAHGASNQDPQPGPKFIQRNKDWLRYCDSAIEGIRAAESDIASDYSIQKITHKIAITSFNNWSGLHSIGGDTEWTSGTPLGDGSFKVFVDYYFKDGAPESEEKDNLLFVVHQYINKGFTGLTQDCEGLTEANKYGQIWVDNVDAYLESQGLTGKVPIIMTETNFSIKDPCTDITTCPTSSVPSQALEECPKKLRDLLGFLKASPNFIGFTLWNAGSKAWGDQSNHGPSPNYPVTQEDMCDGQQCAMVDGAVPWTTVGFGLDETLIAAGSQSKSLTAQQLRDISSRYLSPSQWGGNKLSSFKE